MVSSCNTSRRYRNAILLALTVPRATTFLYPTNSVRPVFRSGSPILRSSLLSEDDTKPLESDRLESNLPESSPLKKIVDERKEFELNLGKALDTLKKDYPKLLTEAPDFSIYHDDLEVVDPSGVTLHGIPNYEMSFRVVHSIVGFFYCAEASSLTFKLVYDWARNNIRVSWNAELIPRQMYGGAKNAHYVDGISVYEMDRSSAKITHHRIEYLLVNGKPVEAPGGALNALQDEVAGVIPIPGGFGSVSEYGSSSSSSSTPGLGRSSSSPGGPLRLSNLMVGARRSSSRPSSTSLFATSNPSSSATFDEDEFYRKNRARAKFGLKALTPEEYEEIQVEVNNLAAQQQLKKDAAAQAAAMSVEKEKKKGGNIFAKLMSNVLEDYTCEGNYDCDRPMVCCDFYVKKVCCASGQMIKADNQRASVPVPQGIEDKDDSSFPRGGPDGMKW